MAGDVEIVVQSTPEKFRGMAEELVPPLLELLLRRNELEREICARSIKLREEKIAAGVCEHQTVPAEQELWEEYRRRYLELVRPHCTEKLLKWGAAGSFGRPARYDYLFGNPEAKVFFTMKTAKKAVVETICQKPTDTRYRFTLRLSEDSWKVDGADYCFGNDVDWHSERHI